MDSAQKGDGSTGEVYDEVPEALRRAEEIAEPEKALGRDSTPEPDYPRYRVESGDNVRLADVNPDESEHYSSKKEAEKDMENQRERIAELQTRMYAEGKQSLLIVLQAMDTGGKD